MQYSERQGHQNMGSDFEGLKKIVWISWEKQRRSITLSSRLNADYLQLDYSDSHFLIRYLKSIFITTRKILSDRKSIIFVQNPSMILAALATALCRILNVEIIVDRHTDKYILESGKGFVYKILLFLSNYTLRNANLTLVTNKELVITVQDKGGRAFILPDPFPQISNHIDTAKIKPKKNLIECVVVASWSNDEPIYQIFEAAEKMSKVDFYITGSPKKRFSQLIAKKKPENVIVTGYLSDKDYYGLMNQCDFVMAITTDKNTLVCGGYEAIALFKPLLTGNSGSLKNYFGNAAAYTDGSAEDITMCVLNIIENIEEFKNKTISLYTERTFEWEIQFDKLKLELRYR
jgi:hypothetical protein